MRPKSVKNTNVSSKQYFVYILWFKVTLSLTALQIIVSI